MKEKQLGKIVRASFGIVPDRDNLFGLHFEFRGGLDGQ